MGNGFHRSSLLRLLPNEKKNHITYPKNAFLKRLKSIARFARISGVTFSREMAPDEVHHKGIFTPRRSISCLDLMREELRGKSLYV